MLDWILSKNLAEIHFSQCKNLDATVPEQLLAGNAHAIAYKMEEYKNPGLVVIFHCLNSFERNNNFAFSL